MLDERKVENKGNKIMHSILRIFFTVVVVVIGFCIFMLIMVSRNFSPSKAEISEMQKVLYNIEGITLYQEDDNRIVEHKIDMNKFRELIPDAECHKSFITKGKRIDGSALMKNGKIIKISIPDMYAVMYVYVKDNKSYDYSFEKVTEKWVDLIK